MVRVMRSSAGDATLARFPFSLNSRDEVANPALWGGRGHRWGPSSPLRLIPELRWGGVWFSLFLHKKKKEERNGSVFMLTHNDWFHWAPRIITKGFPLLNGNYKRQIDSKQLTSWVKQLSPQCSCGWVMPPRVGAFIGVSVRSKHWNK